MKTLMLRSPFFHTHHSPILTSLKPPSSTQTTVTLTSFSAPFQPFSSTQTKSTHTDNIKPSSPITKTETLLQQNTKYVVLGAVSVGVMMFLMGMDDQKALALGPEGPLMEEFWDNVRRYGLYILTVSSGALYTIFQPIYELLKNPISAILVLTILGGAFFIVSQVVSAMIGATDFDYQYYY